MRGQSSPYFESFRWFHGRSTHGRSSGLGATAPDFFITWRWIRGRRRLPLVGIGTFFRRSSASRMNAATTNFSVRCRRGAGGLRLWGAAGGCFFHELKRNFRELPRMPSGFSGFGQIEGNDQETRGMRLGNPRHGLRSMLRRNPTLRAFGTPARRGFARLCLELGPFHLALQRPKDGSQTTDFCRHRRSISSSQRFRVFMQTLILHSDDQM